MLYYNFKIGDNEYKCKLTTKDLVEVERRLKKNPLTVFMSITNNELPKMEDMLTIFHASLQSYNHGISMEEVYDIYDDYVDSGKTFVDFIPEIMEIYKVSGLIKEDKKTTKKKTTKKETTEDGGKDSEEKN